MGNRGWVTDKFGNYDFTTNKYQQYSFYAMSIVMCRRQPPLSGFWWEVSLFPIKTRSGNPIQKKRVKESSHVSRNNVNNGTSPEVS